MSRLAATLMHMRARVERRTAGPANRWGAESSTTWATVAGMEAVPCRAWHPTDEREIIDGEINDMVGVLRIIMAADTAIASGDRIAEVVDRRGRTMFDGPMDVTAVQRSAFHLVVMARSVQGGA